MTMNKYATYRVFKNKQTGEIVRVAHTNDDKEMKSIDELTEAPPRGGPPPRGGR